MSDQQSQVQVELLNAYGESEGTFFTKLGQSFSEWAQDAWLSLPTSCCAGACFTCCCRIVEGADNIDIGLVSVPLIDVDEDQMLTCVWWAKEKLFSDGQFHKIVLQKLM